MTARAAATGSSIRLADRPHRAIACLRPPPYPRREVPRAGESESRPHSPRPRVAVFAGPSNTSAHKPAHRRSPARLCDRPLLLESTLPAWRHQNGVLHPGRRRIRATRAAMPPGRCQRHHGQLRLRLAEVDGLLQACLRLCAEGAGARRELGQATASRHDDADSMSGKPAEGRRDRSRYRRCAVDRDRSVVRSGYGCTACAARADAARRPASCRRPRT